MAATALSGCSGPTARSATGSGDPAPGGGGGASVGASAAAPTAHLLGSARHHSLQRPVVVVATHGTLTSVVLQAGSSTVPGRASPHARHWQSTGRLAPSTTYTAVVHLSGPQGQPVQKALQVRTGKATRLLTMTATPGPRWTVGVAEPVVVTFNRPVPNRAVVQRRMSVSTDAGRVTGAWHWFSPTVVHYRPRHFWPVGTTVQVHVDLAGLYAGRGIWGDRNHDWTWRVGDRHVTYVNASRHTFRVTDNGTTVARWPTGMGMPGFVTRDGVYTVLGTLPVVRMTSCSVGLSCTPGSPNYYALTVHWDTQLTDTGTYIHAAPWDSEMGVANTSHGCIHLSTANAKRFYRFSQPGDVVIVRGSGRPPDLPADPGMMDWNMSWSQWLAGSALRQ